MGWPNPTADADQSLWPIYHSSMHGTDGNRTFFANDELDQLIEAARQELDEDERESLYHEAQTLLLDEVPGIHFRDGEVYHVIQDNLENVEFDAHSNPDFRNLTIN